MKYDVLLEVRRNVPGDEIAGIPDDVEVVTQRWAKILPIGGREYYQAEQIESTVSHRVLMEYFDGADSSQWLALPDVNDPENPKRTFHAKSVINVGERNRQLEWMCEEVAS